MIRFVLYLSILLKEVNFILLFKRFLLFFFSFSVVFLFQLSLKAEVLETTSQIVDIEAGDGFTAILENNGSVWMVGRNDGYQLGIGDNVDRFVPEKMNSEKFSGKVIELKGSSGAIIAKTDTGNYYFWGSSLRSLPVLFYSESTTGNVLLDYNLNTPSSTTGHSSISILTPDGKIKNSGSNYYGAYGNGMRFQGSTGHCTTDYNYNDFTDFSYNTKKEVTISDCFGDPNGFKQIESSVDLDNVKQLSNDETQYYFSALTNANEIYGWNYSSLIPRKLTVPSGAVVDKIYQGRYLWFTTTDNKLFRYDSAQNNPVEFTVGDGTVGIKDIDIFSTGELFLLENGKVYAKGNNSNGQYGNVLPLSNITTISDTGIENIVKIDMGASHSLMLKDSGELVAYGTNNFGELAKDNPNIKDTFVKNNSLSNVKDVYTGYSTSYALTTSNELFIWGAGSNNFRSGETNIPIKENVMPTIPAGENVEIFGSKYNAYHGGLKIGSDKFYTFGANSYEALARNGAAYNPLPVENFNPEITNTNLIDLAIGYYGGLALNNEGKIYTWGFDEYNALGLGYKSTTTTDGRVSTIGLTSFQKPLIDENLVFKRVFVNSIYGRFALTETNELYAWGYNGYGQLGFSGSSTVTTPTKVTTLANPVKEVVGAAYHTFFIDTNNDVWAVGRNDYGNLGLGNTTNVSTPVKINSFPSPVKEIFSGMYTNFALLENGDVYGWGDNRYGQLGIGDFIQRNDPRKIETLSNLNIKDIAPGYRHTIASTIEGDVYVTGADSSGELGLGQESINEEPTVIVFKPLVSISNSDNQSFSINDTLTVTGSVLNKTENASINLAYEITSVNGVVDSGTIKDYTSSSTPENFEKIIDFATYPLGGYTLRVVATANGTTSGESYINFNIVDTIPPEITATFSPNTNGTWKTDNVYFDVVADDIGGSGFSNFKYALTTNTAIPSAWDATYVEKNKRVLVNRSGIFYLHLEASDGDNNTTYQRLGPFNVDVTNPIFSYSLTPTAKIDRFNLPVSIIEASNLLVRKWAKGDQPETYFDTNGNQLLDSIDISENGPYTLFARDENGQKTREVFSVEQLIYKPVLDEINEKTIVPFSAQNNTNISTQISHAEASDPTKLVLNLNSSLFNSINTISGIKNDSIELFNFNLSSLTPNVKYTGSSFLQDGQAIKSDAKPIELEIYKANFQTASSKDGIHLDWTASKLAEKYRIIKNGTIVYEGTSNTFLDTDVISGENPTYELQTFDGTTYTTISTSNITKGDEELVSPTSIVFPPVTLGETFETNASEMDLEYVLYQNSYELQKDYTITVESSDLVSNSLNRISIENLQFLNTNLENALGESIQNISTFDLSETSRQIVNSNDLSLKDYVKWNVPKENILLSIPDETKIEKGTSETFSSIIYIDFNYVP